MSVGMIAIQITNAHVLDGAERYMPSAKTGNLKDPMKIREKELEHQDRWLSSLGGSVLFSIPTDVILAGCCVTADGMEQVAFDEYALWRHGPTPLTKAFEDLSNSGADHLPMHIDVIVGVSPHVDAQRLSTLFVRSGKQVPRWLAQNILRFNPWREVGVDFAEIDSISAAELLGIEAPNLAVASLKLASRFVPGLLRP